MLAFLAGRGLDDPKRRLHLAAGSPGIAASLDLETHDRLRAVMLCLLRVSSGLAQFSEWAKASEAASARKADRLEQYLEVFYTLLEDLLLLQNQTGSLRNADLQSELAAIAAKVSVRLDSLGDGENGPPAPSRPPQHPKNPRPRRPGRGTQPPRRRIMIETPGERVSP